MKWQKNSLLYKVLLIVIIPLAFEIGIFSTLLGIQHSQEVEAQRINRLRLISACVNQITAQLLQMQTAFENFQNPAMAAMAVNKSFKDLYKSFEEIAQLTDNDEQKHKVVMLSLFELRQTNQELNQLKHAALTNEFDDLKALGRTFRPRFHEHLHRVYESGFLQLAADAAAELNTDKTAATRAREIMLLKLAVLASLALALISAAVLSKYLISKLNVIAQNAKRMSTREELLKPISGSDEIALVDSSLHAASREIRRLEQAREEILGMVSHDIRNPLSSIKFSVDAMKEAAPDETELYLNSIDSNCDRILSISKNLLDMQKIESGTLSLDLELSSFVDRIAAAVESVEGTRQSRGATIEVVASGDLQTDMDATTIEQILTNLIANAIKFSPKNATIKVSATPFEKGFLVSVADQGKGIPAELLNTVFDRFVQSDEDDYRAKGSVGMGLAICKGLVDMHGGWISVKNLEPRGCQFDFWLPDRARKSNMHRSQGFSA